MKPVRGRTLRSGWVRAAMLVLAVLALTAAVRYPSPRVRTLPNGLRVAVFERPGLPIVQMQLQVPAGLAAEDRGHDGLAFLTSQLLRQGTTSRSGLDLVTELDTLGGTMAMSVTRDVGQVAAGCRTSEFEGLLELMSDAVINPLFEDEAFQGARRQIAGQLGAQAQTPAGLADERAVALAFGTHPYAHVGRGTFESLLGSTREQVRAFHRDHWRPDRAVLVIAGDIDPERAFASVSEWFGRWNGKSVADSSHSAPATRKGTFLYDLPGSPSTEVRAAVLGPGRGDPSYPGWLVAREALEGGLLPAGAHAVLQPAREASLLLVSAAARPESAAVVAGRVQRALQALSAPLPAATLAAARQGATDAWPLSVETLGQWISAWLAGDIAGATADHLAHMPAAIATATADGAARAVRGGYALLLAGPAERMKGRLGGLGVIDSVEAPLGGSPLAEVGVQVSDDQRRRGRQLVAAAVTAHGGLAKLNAAQVSELSAELQLSVAGQSMSGEVRTLRVDPDRLVHVTRFLDFEHRQVLDRARGWTLSTAGDSASILLADSTSLQSFRAILEADIVHVLRAAAAPSAAPYAAGKARLGDKSVDQVEYASKDGYRNRLSLDATTRRVLAVESLPTPQGVWRDRRRWSEYVQVEGVWWPREEVRELDGEQVSKSVLRHIVVNDPVDSTMFRRPVVARGQIRGVE